MFGKENFKFPPFFKKNEGKDNRIEKSLEEIVIHQNNADSIIEKLNLKNIKAVKTKSDLEKSRETFLINSSGMIDYNMVFNIKQSLETIFKENKESYFSFKNYPLVDLGSNGEFGSLSFLAESIGFNGLLISDINKNSRINEEIIEKTKIPFIELNIDMLELVSQLPDSSSNFSLFAIDNAIIRDKNYMESLIKNIERVVPTGGLVISSNSIFEKRNIKDFNSKWKILTGDNYLSKDIFQKK
jgi:hypothetical protein